MKTIVLIPVKNEEWILDQTLKNTAPYVDMVIVADQDSTDRTVEICKQFPNVKVIRNTFQGGHSNKVRWLLLDEARKSEGDKLIICIDADEMISPKGIEEMKKIISEKRAEKGDVFKLRWIQLWKSMREYREEGFWTNGWANDLKNIAFIDNEKINEYRKEFVINDHTSRVPDTNIGKEITVSYPLLHFHFVAWERTQLKQAWYSCSELIEGSRNAKQINNTYRGTLISKNAKIIPTEKWWYDGLAVDEQKLMNVRENWHLKEIISWFDKYGIKFFEPLQIWNIKKLHDIFVKRVGREPISKTYPKWLTALNDIKNKIKNFRL